MDRLKRIVVAFVHGHDHVGVFTQLFDIHASTKALALCAYNNDGDIVALTQRLNFSSYTPPFGTVKRVDWGFVENYLGNACFNG